jgi:hypothetical protein
VFALDEIDKEYVETGIYIDGQYVGLTEETGSTFSVLQGVHTIEVDSTGWSYHYNQEVPFWYYSYAGNDFDYCNPTTITVSSDMTITAHYAYG